MIGGGGNDGGVSGPDQKKGDKKREMSGQSSSSSGIRVWKGEKSEGEGRTREVAIKEAAVRNS